MDIRVDKDSDVPLHEQVTAQLVLLIGTGRLKTGALLPSVRALALRFPSELSERLRCCAEACTPAEVRSAPHRALGAVVVSPQGFVRDMRAVLAPDHSVVVLAYSPAEPHLRTIRELHGPSLIAVVSVSAYFLEMARAVLAPTIGRRHSLKSHLVTGTKFDIPHAADVILCDTMTYPFIRSRCKVPTVLAYRLIAESCFDRIGRAMAGQRSGRRRGKPSVPSIPRRS